MAYCLSAVASLTVANVHLDVFSHLRPLVLVLKQLKGLVTAKMLSIGIIMILAKNLGMDRSTIRHINMVLVPQDTI